MKKLLMITALPAILIFASCGKSDRDGMEDRADDVMRYTPSPMVVGTQAQSGTRTVVDGGVNFPFLSYRMWVESADSAINQWYQEELGYDNIFASRTQGSNGVFNLWYYTPRGASTSSGSVGLFKSKGPVTVYAVYPSSLSFDVADYEHIPFTVGLTDATNYDYMYAVPQSVDPSVVTDLTQNLLFRHTMTLIEFRLSTAYVGTLQVKSITVRARSSQNPDVFGMEGTFSASDGTVIPTAYADNLTIDYGNKTVQWKNSTGTNVLKYTSFGIIVPEIAYQDGVDDIQLEVTFEFYYPDADGDSDELIGKGSTLTFDLAEVKTPDEISVPIAQGLLAGYRYVFNIEIDNFIKHVGYPVAQPWMPEEDGDGNDVTHEIKF